MDEILNDQRCRRIVSTLEDLIPRTSGEISKETGINKRSVDRYLKKHLEPARIVEIDVATKKMGGRKLRTLVWRLTAGFVNKSGYDRGKSVRIIIVPEKVERDMEFEQLQEEILKYRQG